MFHTVLQKGEHVQLKKRFLLLHVTSIWRRSFLEQLRAPLTAQHSQDPFALLGHCYEASVGAGIYEDPVLRHAQMELHCHRVNAIVVVVPVAGLYVYAAAPGWPPAAAARL